MSTHALIKNNHLFFCVRVFFCSILIKTILCVPFQIINIVPSIVTPSGPKDRY